MAGITDLQGSDLVSSIDTTINNDLHILAQLHGDGSNAPNPTYKDQWWADEANDQLKQRNVANTDWIVRGTLSKARLGLDETVWLSTPVEKVNISAFTSGYQDVDISSDTGSDTAKFAILKLNLDVTNFVAAGIGAFLRVRKNGDSEDSDKNAGLEMKAQAGVTGYQTAGLVIVAVDGSEIFEYDCDKVGASTPTFTAKVVLMGYIR